MRSTGLVLACKSLIDIDLCTLDLGIDEAVEEEDVLR